MVLVRGTAGSHVCHTVLSGMYDVIIRIVVWGKDKDAGRLLGRKAICKVRIGANSPSDEEDKSSFVNLCFKAGVLFMNPRSLAKIKN